MISESLKQSAIVAISQHASSIMYNCQPLSSSDPHFSGAIKYAFAAITEACDGPEEVEQAMRNIVRNPMNNLLRYLIAVNYGIKIGAPQIQEVTRAEIRECLLG